jgi:flagellar hook-length control protein FliK
VESAAAGRSADLTSRASRVEVQDNRNRLSDNLSDKPDKDQHELKTRGSVAPGEQRQSAEPVKLLQHPVNAETEIEITPGNESRNLQRSAASLLAEKLEAQAGNDIVRQVKVIMNQANAGELRINLRPDNLGQVRIRIRMEDNRLTGRIFVESAAAREAFRNALDGLQTRLVESGFGAADLEMAWDESPRNFTQNGNPSAGQQNNIEEAVQEFENIIPAVFAGDSADSRVNMVV